MNKAGISFLIVNYFSADLVVGAVRSIRQMINRRDYEIIVYDNSVDKEQRVILNRLVDEQVRVIIGDTNIGFVGANNLLFRQATKNIVVLLNPDTVLPDNSLERLVDLVAANLSIGTAGPMLLNGDGTYQVSCFRFPTLWTLFREHVMLSRRHVYAYDRPHDTSFECDVVKGACCVFRRNLLTGEDLFDKKLVLFSEEVDLCMRMKKKGLINFYCAEAKVIHFGEKSTRRDEILRYVVYHYHRSKFILFRKYFSPVRYRVAALVLLVSLVEKTVLFGVVGKFNKARIHGAIFAQLLFHRV
jgi:GT2 family glycosyltransferase